MAHDSLRKRLFEQHESDMVRMAEMIRDWGPGTERTHSAEMFVRQALFETPSRISQETQYRIYSILSFVMPEDAAYADEPTPEPVLDKQAEMERLYQQQLDQRSCPECGDGMCPVDAPKATSLGEQ